MAYIQSPFLFNIFVVLFSIVRTFTKQKMILKEKEQKERFLKKQIPFCKNEEKSKFIF